MFEKGAHKKPLITHLPLSITIKRLLIITYDSFDDEIRFFFELCICRHRGSYMSAHVLFSLLNDLGKKRETFFPQLV